MGAHYHSVHLKTSDLKAVEAALSAACAGSALRLWVSPVRNGWINAFPSDLLLAEKACLRLSRDLNIPVIHAVLHDSDVFAYGLYHNGVAIDEFNSDPDYFKPASEAEKKRVAGRPELLTALLPAEGREGRLRGILGDADSLGEEVAMQLFMDELGVVDFLSAYDYLEGGEREAVTNWSEYIHVPDLTAEKEARKKQTAAITAQKSQLKKNGLLVDEIKFESFKQKDLHPVAGDPVTGGFLAWTNLIRGTKRWLPPAPPTDAPEINARELLNQANGLSLLKESKEIAAKYKTVISHPTQPYLLCLGFTKLGIADSRTGKLIKQLAAENPLLIPKKIAQWRAAGVEPKPFFELSRDDIFCAAFSPDAQLVFFGTKEGLRIHRFEHLLAAEKTMPAPIQSHETSRALQDHITVHAMVVDAASARILYAASDEMIWSYHWPTGASTPLTPSLGNFRAFDLHVSGNGELLACSLRGPFDEPRQRDKFIVRVWNLRRLIADADAVGS